MEVPIQPLGHRDTQDGGGEPTGALSQDASQTQKADMALFITHEFEWIAHAVTGNAKQQLGHHGQAKQVGRATVQRA